MTIDDVILNDSDMILIAVSKGKVDDIINSIREHGYPNYMIPLSLNN